MKHELQCRCGIGELRNNFARFHFGSCAVEPLGNRAVAEKFAQAFFCPCLGEQVACDNPVACRDKQYFLFTIVDAAGFFVKGYVH